MVTQTITIPDIGTKDAVDVIEILVAVGDTFEKNDSLLTLEGDKATMEVPASVRGTVKAIHIKIGDKVKQGDVIFDIESEDAVASSEQQNTPAPTSNNTSTTPTKAAPDSAPAPTVAAADATPMNVQQSVAKTSVSSQDLSTSFSSSSSVHASPVVRRIAHEFGVDLSKVSGSGRKQRILKEDVQAYVKSALAQVAQGGSGLGLNVAPMPAIDFSQFGDIEMLPLNKIKRLTGQYTHRSWITIPHVTQFDEADITEMEAFRENNKAEAKQRGFNLTPLVFIMKAVVSALRAYPTFNSSLDASGESLILKKYFHLGVAMDTPNGLVVPVIRDVDQKGFMELAEELSSVSEQAREKGLTPRQMQGSCFTISSLGGIGGTGFTPIVNQPDVAILGVSKAKIQPVYMHNEFVPRLIMPFSLSYDHRVIDGAQAARFTQHIAASLADIRRLLL